MKVGIREFRLIVLGTNIFRAQWHT